MERKRESAGPSIHAALLAVGAMVVAVPVAAGALPPPGASDPRQEMVAALAARGPHPSLGDQAIVFDRFVGTWDSEYDTYAPDGSVTRATGTVLFGWIIDGRAMQDVWIGHAKSGDPKERFIGTSLRFFDAKTGVWRVVWVAPSIGSVTTLQGGAVGDRIVLEGRGSDGSWLRWSFNDIRPGAFVWRGETSRDEGKTWRLTQEQRMKRRGGEG